MVMPNVNTHTVSGTWLSGGWRLPEVEVAASSRVVDKRVEFWDCIKLLSATESAIESIRLESTASSPELVGLVMLMSIHTGFSPPEQWELNEAGEPWHAWSTISTVPSRDKETKQPVLCVSNSLSPLSLLSVCRTSAIIPLNEPESEKNREVAINIKSLISHKYIKS